MAYTSRSEAREFECPTCEAAVGAKCVSTRGKKRESVHLERLKRAAAQLGHAPAGTFTVSDGVVSLNGRPVGRVHDVRLELDVQAGEEGWGNLRRGGEESSFSEASQSSSSTEGQTLLQGSAEGKQTELLPDPVDETWALYVELLERPRAVLTPKVRRWINDAHQAVGVEQTQAAIRGLAASSYHREHGYVGIEYAIRPNQGQTVEGRVEMMAAKAGSGGNRPTTVDALLATLPSEARPMVRQWMNDVQDMLRNPDHPGLKATGEARLRELREKARMEPIIEGDRIADWRRTDA